MKSTYKTSSSIKDKIILLISLHFPPETSGGATGAWNRAMSFHKIGYKVFVLSGFPSYPTGKIQDPKYKRKFFLVETIDSFTIIRFRLPSLSASGFVKPFVIFISFVILGIVLFPRVRRLTTKANIVYARSPIVFCFILGILYSKLMRSKYIYEAPDLWPEELVNVKSLLLPFIMSFGKIVAKLSYKSADIIITVSESAANFIIENYKPKAKVYGVPVGVDINKFTPLSIVEARQQLINNNVFPSYLLNKFLILYSGRISEAQKVEDLAMAAEKLKEYDDIVILVIGEGPNKEKLKILKDERSLNNFIIFPIQKRDLMPLIISSVNICTILLSHEPIFEIAIPTKFYEYLCCRKPLIGICRGEVELIIKNNNIGFSCESGEIDKLVSLILRMRRSRTFI